MSDNEMIFELGKVLTFGFVASGPGIDGVEDKVMVILEKILNRHLSDGIEPQYKRDVIKDVLETATKIAKGEITG